MAPTTKSPTPKASANNAGNAQIKATVPATEVSQEEAHKNRQYIITMYIITGLIVIIGGFFVYRLFGAYIRKTNEVKAQDQYISALQQKKSDLVKLQANYQTITQQKTNGLSTADLVLRALPETPDFKTLIGVFENISAASGVQASVSPPTAVAASATSASGSSGAVGSDSTITTGSTPQPFQITVSVTGPYAQLLQFLQNTEKSLRPINFQTMTISGTTGTVQASITFETYYQGQADITNHQEPLK